MRIGWLADSGEYIGGAELTQDEFRKAVPDGIEIIDIPPGEPNRDVDRVVVQNCVTYGLTDMLALEGKPVVKLWHDVGPWLADGIRGWLDTNATTICVSPLQAQYMGLEDAYLIPPALDLQRFTEAGAKTTGIFGSRRGNVCVGSWRNHGKAAHKVAEWAQQQREPVQFFGGGMFAPPGSDEVPYEEMPALLASFERFVFLPNVIEPFGRLVAEAWAAGLELVVNGNVGAAWWVQERPEALETAAEDFWKVVLA